MRKHHLVWIMCVVCIYVTLLVMPVSAEQIEGTCNENVSWKLDTSTGTLTISGQGDMDFGDHAPWWDKRSDVKHVVIEAGVTTIHNKAFSHLSALESVTIPDTVYAIGKSAFDRCTSLKHIELPDTITVVGSYAFSNCTGLTKFVIPSGLTSISYGMFSDCHNLSEVTFHNNIKEIDGYGFYWCKSLKSLTLPQSVTTIGGSAFQGCRNLESIDMGPNVTSIGGNAFMDCVSLTRVTIPDGVNEISRYTFSSCSTLECVEMGAGVSKISPTAFKNCDVLSTFVFCESNPYFCVDEFNVIYTKDRKELVLFPNTITGAYQVSEGTEIIRAYACHDLEGLTGIVIPASVTVIDNYAFCGCINLKTVSLSNGLKTIGTDAFARTSLTEITIPATVTKIEVVAFSGCTSLSKVVFCGDAPEIQDAAFSQVTANVYYPAGNPTWDDDVRVLYWGLLTWIPYEYKCDHTEVVDDGCEATCGKTGLTEGKHCSICGEVLIAQQSIPATGAHNYGEWVEVTAPTIEETGLAERTCTVCGHVEQKMLEKLEEVETTEPVETDPAVTDPTEPAETDPTEPSVTEPEKTDPTVPETTDPPANEKEEPDDDSASWVLPVVCCVIVAVAAGIAVVVIRKKKKA